MALAPSLEHADRNPRAGKSGPKARSLSQRTVPVKGLKLWGTRSAEEISRECTVPMEGLVRGRAALIREPPLPEQPGSHGAAALSLDEKTCHADLVLRSAVCEAASYEDLPAPVAPVRRKVPSRPEPRDLVERTSLRSPRVAVVVRRSQILEETLSMPSRKPVPVPAAAPATVARVRDVREIRVAPAKERGPRGLVSFGTQTQQWLDRAPTIRGPDTLGTVKAIRRTGLKAGLLSVAMVLAIGAGVFVSSRANGLDAGLEAAKGRLVAFVLAMR